MTTTTVHGITVALITEEQIGQAMDNIMADWPKGQYQQLRRYVKDTLHDCAVLAGHYEDAARLRASPWRKLETAPRGEVIMYCDARGNRWIDVHPGHPANSLGYPPTCWMPLPDGPSSSPSQIDHSNDSARHNGQSETASAVHAKAMHKLAASLICPPAADDEPARLRKAGAL